MRLNSEEVPFDNNRWQFNLRALVIEVIGCRLHPCPPGGARADVTLKIATRTVNKKPHYIFYCFVSAIKQLKNILHHHWNNQYNKVHQ